MRKRKQQSLKKKPRNWYLRGFTSGLISSEEKKASERKGLC